MALTVIIVCKLRTIDLFTNLVYGCLFKLSKLNIIQSSERVAFFVVQLAIERTSLILLLALIFQCF